jgi:hypothetical protein
MLTSEFDSNTIRDLANGTTIENGDQKVIIGELNTVAWTNKRGEWQITEEVVWDSVEDSGHLDHLLRRVKLNDIISEKFPEGTLDEFYSESSNHAMVIDKNGTVWQIYPDGGTKYFR